MLDNAGAQFAAHLGMCSECARRESACVTSTERGRACDLHGRGYGLAGYVAALRTGRGSAGLPSSHHYEDDDHQDTSQHSQG